MFSRLQWRRSNLQDLGRLSKSCPAVDSPAHERDHDDDTDSDFLSSPASQSESSEEVSPPVSRAEKQLARQSLRWAKKREVEQKRNLEENKISMDDYLGKQASFRLWLLEEQKKQAKDVSSPKRKTYFKMFVRLWNKRHLPAKYYESRLSHHMDEDEEKASGEMIISPQNNPNRPKFSLIQNSPALDPTIFPHTIDLSSDSIAQGTPATPFSTFGKSTPSSSLTPIRFSAHNVGGSTTRTSIFREKKALRSGCSKENATPSLPVKATISPRKRISSSQDRSLDRMLVSWSPQGYCKMKAVKAPRCPSPFGKISASESQEKMITDSSLLQKVSTFPRFPVEYQQVKDCISFSTSPTYVEIPFENSSQIFSSQDSQSVGKQVKDKGHRRRSHSLDETPSYAVPDRSGKERHWSQHQAALNKSCSDSPPPLPPKRFDPHVEGLGIPFSPPPVIGVANPPHAPASGELTTEDEMGKKTGKGRFKGKLPWFGKKLTSRRRSRSCEVLSPSPHVAGERSRVVAQGESVGSQFPLVELERSPTLNRRVFAHRPHKSPASDSQKTPLVQMSKLKEKPRCKQELQLEQELQSEEKSQQRMQLAHFELTEYTSSPFRAHVGEKTSPPAPLSNFKRTKSIRRRRSTSVEHIYSLSMEPEQNSSPFYFHSLPQSADMSRKVGNAQAQSQQWFQPSSCGSDTGGLPSLTPQTAATCHLIGNSSDTVTPVPSGQFDFCDLSSQQCGVYHKVKTDIKKQLSHLICKMQEPSCSESTAAQFPNADTEVDPSMQVTELQSSPKNSVLKSEDIVMEVDVPVVTEIPELQQSSPKSVPKLAYVAMEVDTSMEIGELQSSPKRLGQAEDREPVDGAEGGSTPYRNSIRSAAARYLPAGQMISNSKEVSMQPCSQSVDFSVAPHSACRPHDIVNFVSKDPASSLQDSDNLDSAVLTTDPAVSHNAALSGDFCSQGNPNSAGSGTKTSDLLSVASDLADSLHTGLKRHTVEPDSMPVAASVNHLNVTSMPKPAALRDVLQQQASVHIDAEKHPEALVPECITDTKTDKCLASFTVDALHTVMSCRELEPAEASSHKEATRFPVGLTGVAFSESVPSGHQVGKCQPLDTALPSLVKARGSTINWSSPCRSSCQQRRRSRSVGEVCLSGVLSSMKGSWSHQEEEKTFFSPVGSSVVFTSDVSGSAYSKEFTKLEAASVADPKLRAILLPSSTSMPPNLESESIDACPDMLDSPASRQPIPEQIMQLHVIKSQQAKKILPKSLAQVMETPQQTVVIKTPPPVAEKPKPYKQTGLDVPMTQQPVEQEEGISSVKAIMQKFGGSLRTNRPSNRRRSRSVGDMSALYREEDVTSSVAGAETNGFSSVRAFWDRLKGRGGETDCPVVTLQRKPSTLRRLQQQLGLNEKKPELGKNEALGKSLDDRPNPFIPVFPPEMQMSENGNSTYEMDNPANSLDKSNDTLSQNPATSERQPQTHIQDMDKHTGHLLSSVCKEENGTRSSPLPTQQNTPASKILETSGGMSIKTSPFVTVRRQASRKRNAGSPCYQGTPEKNTSAAESSHSSRERDGEITSDALSTHAPTTPTFSLSTVQSTVEIQTVTFTALSEFSTMSTRFVHEDVEMACTSRDQLLPGKGDKTLMKPFAPSIKEEEKKTSKGPPPKLLPKPKKQLLSERQKVRDTTRISPQISSKEHIQASRTGKRRSQETDGVDVPKKLSAVGAAHERKGAVTRSASNAEAKTQEDSISLPQSSCQHSKTTKVKRAILSVAVSEKFAICDATYSDGSSPVKCINSARQETRKQALSRRCSSEKEVNMKTLFLRGQGKEKESQNESPLVKRKSSGKQPQGNSSMAKPQSTGREPKTAAPAVRRVSSGKESTTPRRRSSGRVSVAKGSGVRGQGSIASREGGSVSRNNSGRGRANALQPVAGVSERQIPTLQTLPPELSTSSSIPMKKTGCTSQGTRDAHAVRRCNSSRGETVVSTSTTSLVKRFNSLRHETTSSSAKRRSGQGRRISAGGSKHNGMGRGRLSKENNHMRRSSSKKRYGNEAQEGTVSRTGSFRNHGTAPPQSPTFIRITRRLGAFDQGDNSSDDDKDNGGKEKSDEQTLPEGEGKFTRCYLPVSAEHRNGSEQGRNEVQVETNIDLVSEVLEAIEDRAQRKKRTVISTLV